jgi:hypothetical protein
VLVGACVGGGVGVGLWGGGSWDERRPLPLYLEPWWGIRGRDERISGRMRGLVGD